MIRSILAPLAMRVVKAQLKFGSQGELELEPTIQFPQFMLLSLIARSFLKFIIINNRISSELLNKIW